MDFTVNRLILGDSLAVLQTLPDECVDVVYLDPPVFSNRTYEVIWGDAGEIRSFQDCWAGGAPGSPPFRQAQGAGEGNGAYQEAQGETPADQPSQQRLTRAPREVAPLPASPT